MTATDELRRLLEEHGIKHFDYDKGGRTQTQWAAPDGTRHFTYETYNNPSKTAKLVISWFPTPEQAIAVTMGNEINGETSDGYHTFNELYHHRAVLFSVIVRDYRELAWKARRHHDGTMYDGMFIVGIETPDGQATYHYDLDPYWDMFDCEEREFAPEWDGHTPDEAIARIATLGRGTCEYAIKDNMNETEGMGDVWIECSACHCVFDYYADEWLMNMHYCPNCGARVERREE